MARELRSLQCPSRGTHWRKHHALHIGGNTMHWMIRRARSMLLLMPALALAIPAYAEPREPELNDSQVPGSVIVFPKFIQGTVTLSGGGTAPRTEIEIGVVCPEGEPCAEHEPVK